MAGNAVLRAAEDLKDKLLEATAEKLQTLKKNLIARSGEILDHDDPTKHLSFIEAARLAEAKFGTLSAVGWYAPPKLGGTYKGAGAGPSPSYSFTAHVAEVEVDEETGHVKVCKVWSAHDCGRALNKTLVEGQIEGSVHMGIGEALSEEMTYTRSTKETPGGLLKATSLLDYKIPTSLDTPPIEVSIIETNDPEGPLGAKEAGEGPLLSVPPAIANAIYDAVGIRLSSVPFTPEKVLATLRGQPLSEKVIPEPVETPVK
jgi:CO/xanthine dehydrogenase Mo-binding subunit